MEPAYSQEEFDEVDPQASASTSHIRFAIRGMRLSLHIIRGLVLSVIYPRLGAKTQRSILGRWSQTLMEILEVRVEMVGAGPMALREAGVIVANHISWLDVFALNAVFPSSFVAKSDVSGWPIIGTLCKQTRTIFISRTSRSDTLRANRVIAERIAEGEWVTLFPEGTSTDGTDVAPFHASLFQPAVDAACPVLPAAIYYHDGAGNPRHDAAYIGDMSFFESLTNVLSCDRLHVTLVFLPVLQTSARVRRQLAEEAHGVIRNVITRIGKQGAHKPVVTNL